jgi:hypothetical protein
MADIVVNGNTSGAVTLSAPAVAGTVTVTLPSASGTMLTTASSTGISGSAISSGTVPEAYGGTGTSTGYYGFKNRIINGAMVIDQRNAGASVTPTVAGYTLDRWTVDLTQASKFSVRQNAGSVANGGSVVAPAGFTNWLGITSLSAYSVLAGDYFILQQRIEGLNCTDLAWGTANAKTVTLSFQVYSSLTGTFGGVLANSGFSRTYPFSYSVPVANTWTTISVTIAGDTSGTWLTTNGVGITVNFSLGTGSTFSGTAGAWSGTTYTSVTGAVSVVGTNTATFYITGVQLEKGSTATSFDYRPYGTELALCQRYCLNVKGGNDTSVLNGPFNTTSFLSYVTMPVEMRSAPSLLPTGITGYGTGATEYRVYVFNQAGGGFVAAPATAGAALDFAGTRTARLVFNVAATWTTIGTFDATGGALDVGSSVKILLSAEL